MGADVKIGITKSHAELPAHSPLGASGAERWMNCPGSVSLAKGIDDEEDDTFSAPGTAAHTLAADLLIDGGEAWLHMGQVIHVGDKEIEVTVEMANAVTEYVDLVRKLHPKTAAQGVETRFHCPALHPLFFGTSDKWDIEGRVLHVHDFKYGAGIVVEAIENPQLMYYAVGVLEREGLWNSVDHIVLHIHQPRGWHYAGHHRTWTISTDDLWSWTADRLLPAMHTALSSGVTKSGEHCRFCPVRTRACPQLMKDIDEMEAIMVKAQEEGVDRLTNEQIARFLDLAKIFKIVEKAAKNTAFGRLEHGQTIPGYKLAPAKVNREWKEEAKDALIARYGDDAFEPEKLKSPAQIEQLPEGASFTAEYAFKPVAGLAVVEAGDSRPAVNKDVKSGFKPVTKKPR